MQRGGGVEWGTVIVTVITFAILLALLKKFAWGPLKEVMDNVNVTSTETLMKPKKQN